MHISHAVPTSTPSLVPIPSSTTTAATSDPSETSGPSSTSGVDSVPPSMPTCVSLSPDALMAYCSSRLNSLDTQMNSIFATQQQNATLTSQINNIASLLGDLSPSSANGSSATVNVAPSDILSVSLAYQQAINAAGPNTSLGASLQKDLLTFTAQTANSSTIPSSTIASLTQSLKNDSGDLNSDSELSMINLQSLMSQRETAVQLTTNLVQSLGQQSSDIAKNIGS